MSSHIASSDGTVSSAEQATYDRCEASRTKAKQKVHCDSSVSKRTETVEEDSSTAGNPAISTKVDMMDRKQSGRDGAFRVGHVSALRNAASSTFVDCNRATSESKKSARWQVTITETAEKRASSKLDESISTHSLPCTRGGAEHRGNRLSGSFEFHRRSSRPSIRETCESLCCDASGLSISACT